MEQVLRDLHEAVDWIPEAEYAAEAQGLKGGVPPAPAAGATPRRPALARPPDRRAPTDDAPGRVR